jgi:hypothetical protein
MDTLRHNTLTMMGFQQSGMTSIELFIVQGAMAVPFFYLRSRLLSGRGMV